MKYAILSDIHSNLDALQVVLAHIKEQKCTHYVCLGDVVGYGPNPIECLEIVRGLDCPTVMGNHDEYCATSHDLTGFNPMAADAIKWTREQLSEEQKKWLHDLKYVRNVESFTVVHATLDLPEKWAYVFDKLAAAASFNYQHTAVCFNGHTHVPIAFVRGPTGIQGGMYTKIKVEVGRKYFVNCGSIGQPRDRNPKAAYVTFDLINNLIELHRLDYNIEAVQKKIHHAGLPVSLADRLAQGR
ncbi:MAG TPA: metallophosphoesterase family protein [Verrucomicrobiae bacterium]|nr:metallophosphoesterase family protein [Verrucomicrobiae bacterium]